MDFRGIGSQLHTFGSQQQVIEFLKFWRKKTISRGGGGKNINFEENINTTSDKT